MMETPRGSSSWQSLLTTNAIGEYEVLAVSEIRFGSESGAQSIETLWYSA